MPQQPPSYDAVLFEQMNSKFDTIMAGMTAMEDRLVTRMDERFAHQDARFDVIEGVLHQHSLRFSRIESRLDRVELRLGGVESRLDRVETKLDDVATFVKRHDHAINSLQA